MAHRDTSSGGSPGLLDPVEVGGLALSNRVVMTAMTRARATADGVPTALMIDYYRQRASAGLIISEGIAVSPMAKGYAFTPGLYTVAQIDGWRPITDAVHAQGGRIMAQLWHVGRISHPAMLPNGAAPIAPSPIRANSAVYAGEGFLPCAEPREMTQVDIDRTITEFAAAADAAQAAGFDGVQIHAGNGYLPDQFLRDGSNRRTDDYGGSVTNRLRFLLELVDAVAAVSVAERLSVRIAPVANVNDIFDSAPETLFVAVAEALGGRNIAFLDVVEGATTGPRDIGFDPQLVRRAFGGTYLGNNGYTPQLAITARQTGAVDLVGFGRAFISNPDLVARLRNGYPLAPDARATYYGAGVAGYTDYPAFNIGVSRRSDLTSSQQSYARAISARRESSRDSQTG